MLTSIVIRTMNEKEHLANLLRALQLQDYEGETEIIVVDNESSDGTVELARESGAQILTIKRSEFTFPRSINMGIATAQGEVVVLLVGHALPLKSNWLRSGISHFSDERVAGVYSRVIPKKKSSFAEKLYYWPGYLSTRIKGPYAVKRVDTGVFGATNIALRKSLWNQHRFDERYELGGEDAEWARWALTQGYSIVCDYRFGVRHSHGLNSHGLKQQIHYWNNANKSSKFDKNKLSFRKDLKF